MKIDNYLMRDIKRLYLDDRVISGTEVANLLYTVYRRGLRAYNMNTVADISETEVLMLIKLINGISISEQPLLVRLHELANEAWINGIVETVIRVQRQLNVASSDI